MISPDTGPYHIRLFGAADAAVYKAIRLEALRLEPGMFGNPYAMEAAFPDAYWPARVSNPTGAVFGLYCGEDLVGLTSIIVHAETQDEAYMTQSYIRKEHRGRGLSRMLYDARLAWAHGRGLKRLTIGHRESNHASKAANQRYGFRFSHQEDRLWPD